MFIRFSREFAITVCLVSCFLPLSRAQQTVDQPALTAPKKVLTPEQKVYQQQGREWMEGRHARQAQANEIFEVEMAAEKAGDCPNANTTYDFNVCYGNVLTAADERLKSFEQVIRDLQAPSPRMAGAPEAPANGIAGPMLTSEQLTAELNSVEQLWRQYRTTACSAAFHQFSGGTGGPSFEAQCELKLTRDHMRELNMIYGGDLHL
jgi:uncharacterized protein YecT (DUF1311 family)